MSRLVVFPICGVQFALPIPGIGEVVQRARPREVPGAPEEVAGVFALRGRVVTLLDTERILAPEKIDNHTLLWAGSCTALRFDPPNDQVAITAPDEQRVISDENTHFEEVAGEGPKYPWLDKVLRVKGELIQVLDPLEFVRIWQEKLVTDIKLS